MLVTCASCKSPVFVSSTVLSAGEAEVVCATCSMRLRVTAAADVRTGDPSGEPSSTLVEQDDRPRSSAPGQPGDAGAASAPLSGAEPRGSRRAASGPPAPAGGAGREVPLEMPPLPSYAGEAVGPIASSPPAPADSPDAPPSAPGSSATFDFPGYGGMSFPVVPLRPAGPAPRGENRHETASGARRHAAPPSREAPLSESRHPVPGPGAADGSTPATARAPEPEQAVRDSRAVPRFLSAVPPVSRGSEPAPPGGYVVRESGRAERSAPSPDAASPHRAVDAEAWAVTVAGASLGPLAEPPTIFPPSRHDARPIVGSPAPAVLSVVRDGAGGASRRPRSVWTLLFAPAGAAAALAVFLVLRAFTGDDGVARRPEPTARSGSKAGAPATSAPLRRPHAADTGSAAGYYHRANALIAAGDPAAAIAALDACLAVDPGYRLAYRSRGVAFMLLGRERSAVDAYSRFVELAPRHRDASSARRIIDGYRRRASE